MISSVFHKDIEERTGTYQRTNLKKDTKHQVPKKITHELLYRTTNQKHGHRQLKGGDSASLVVWPDYMMTPQLNLL